METKKLKNKCSCLNYLGDQYESFIVDCPSSGGGKSGGLIFLWNLVFNVKIKMHDLFYIDTVISYSTNNSCWRCTDMYGYPNWLIFGDFNMILNSNEKLGGNLP